MKRDFERQVLARLSIRRQGGQAGRFGEILMINLVLTVTIALAGSFLPCNSTYASESKDSTVALGDFDKTVDEALQRRGEAHYSRITPIVRASCLGAGLHGETCVALYVAEYLAAAADSSIATVAVRIDDGSQWLVYFGECGSYPGLPDRSKAFFDVDSVKTALSALGFDKISEPEMLHCALGAVITVDCVNYGGLFWRFEDLKDGKMYLFLRTNSVVEMPERR